jgi:regulatory protein
VPETDAVETALQALRHRDRTVAELDARLEERGVGEEARREALNRLERLGYVDDGRFAAARAEQLARRGVGDALIRHDLERRGVEGEVVETALEALEPERDRALRIVAERGRSARTARYLASRGFADEAVEEAVAAGD